jgi:hypothetical protein
VSAVPGEIMCQRVKREEPPCAHPESEDSGGTLWQWLAIGLLLGCWLAEATWCIEGGY